MHEILHSQRYASWLMNLVSELLNWLGIDVSLKIRNIVYLIVVVALAIGAGIIVKRIIMVIMGRVLAVKFSDISHSLSQSHALERCGRVIPPVILLSFIPFAFNSAHHLTHVILLATIIYTTIATVIAINSLLTFTWIRYNTKLNDKNLPLKGIVDIAKGAMWVIAVIVIISLIVDKSPLALLTGLGAFAAVLLLIFKDSILGLVAGVQLSVNDMLRVGDWISVPGTDANGIVMDVSLVVVKVRNWNNTVSMIPPYSLVSSHFVNWRYMKDTGSRQIEMSILIDINTVHPLSDDELHTIQTKVPLLKDYIDIKLKQRTEGHTANVFNDEAGVNGTIDTNLGLLRAYLNLYLPKHPYVYSERMIMVRLMQPGPTGFPLQVFCYVTTAEWKDYESIQSDIFEHIIAIAPTFGLSAYEQPSSRSVFSLASTPGEGAPYYGTAPVVTPTPNPSTNNHVGIK